MRGSHDALAGAPTLPLDKIQGFIVRGYRMSFVRHFALTVGDLDKARDFLTGLVDGREGWPQITTAEQWGPLKPDYCLNIGFTYKGLEAMAVPQRYLEASFNNRDHLPFVNGSAASAGEVGDVGESDPGRWILSDQDFHVILSLYTHDEPIRDAMTYLLLDHCLCGFDRPGADRIFDSQALNDDEVYFGYRDNIAQPILNCSQFTRPPDGGQDLVDTGAFLLGTATGAFAQTFPVPTPAAFGMYGCFGAFRILKQEVEKFDDQVASLAPAFGAAFGITDEKVQIKALKAKICGRWPNGTPLSLHPIDGNEAAPPLPRQDRNNFQFVLPNGDPKQPPGQSPDLGTNCPVSSHIRRANMRHFPLASSDPSKRRIMRRAMPYQTPFDRDNRQTGERGLMGFFLSACLLEQFEFVQKNWINNGSNPFSLANDPADPVMGTNKILPGGGPITETLPKPGQPLRDALVLTMDTFVTTRGSAYCYFPGMDGIRWIAAPIEQAV
jgi:deferrochelatase/peroxidase EfeB